MKELLITIAYMNYSATFNSLSYIIHFDTCQLKDISGIAWVILYLCINSSLGIPPPTPDYQIIKVSFHPVRLLNIKKFQPSRAIAFADKRFYRCQSNEIESGLYNNQNKPRDKPCLESSKPHFQFTQIQTLVMLPGNLNTFSIQNIAL